MNRKCIHLAFIFVVLFFTISSANAGDQFDYVYWQSADTSQDGVHGPLDVDPGITIRFVANMNFSNYSSTADVRFNLYSTTGSLLYTTVERPYFDGNAGDSFAVGQWKTENNTSSNIYVYFEAIAFDRNTGSTLESMSQTSSRLTVRPIPDTTPPTHPGTPDLSSDDDTGYSSSDNITKDTSLHFTWSASTDTSGIKRYDYVLDSGNFISNGTSRSLSLTVSSGGHYLYVRAVDNADNYSDVSSLGFTVDTSAPPSPTLVSPTNNSTTLDTTPTFDWNSASGAYRYYYQVTDKDYLGTGNASGYTKNTYYTQNSPMQEDDWYWSVCSEDEAGNQNCSSEWTVTIKSPEYNAGISGVALSIPNVTAGSGDSANPAATLRNILDPGTFQLRIRVYDDNDNQVFTNTTNTGELPTGNTYSKTELWQPQKAGRYYVVAEALDINGNSLPGNSSYPNPRETSYYTINKTQTNLTGNSFAGIVGETVQLQVRLMIYNTLTPISNRPIHFFINNAELSGSPVTTNSSGYAILNYTIPQSLSGTNQFKASFAGDETFLESGYNSDFTVNKTSTTLAINNVTGVAGGTVELTANLKTSTSQNISSKSIYFSANNTLISGSPVQTDQNGTAKITYSIPENQQSDLSIKAEFSGDNQFIESESTATLFVKKTYSISGSVHSVRWPNHPLSGVTVRTDLFDTAVTDQNGHYTLTNVVEGSRTVLASKNDYYAIGTDSIASRTVNLSNNISGIDFTNFQCKASATVNISVDKEALAEGETANITVTLGNTDESVQNVTSYLDVSFDNSLVSVGTPAGDGWTEIQSYAPGQNIYKLNSSEELIYDPADETLISGWRDGAFSSGNSYSFSFPITLKNGNTSGQVIIKYRGTIGDKRDPLESTSSVKDQQGFYIKTKTLVISKKFNVSGKVTSNKYPNLGISGAEVWTDDGIKTTTDPNGYYQLSGVIYGNRTIKVSKDDYRTSENIVIDSRELMVDSDITGVDFNDFSCFANAKVTLTTTKDVYAPGETVNLSVSLVNDNLTVTDVEGYIDVSFDDSLLTVGEPSGGNWNLIKKYPIGSNGLWRFNASTGDMEQFTSTTALVSAYRQGYFEANKPYSLTIPLTINKGVPAGDIEIKFRGSIGDSRDPGEGNDIDQQNFKVYKKTISVSSGFVAQLGSTNISMPKVGLGQQVEISLSGKNAGEYTAAYGGITLQVREAFTDGAELSVSQSADGAVEGTQSVWWKGDTLGTGNAAQYLHLEPSWANWESGKTHTVFMTVTPNKTGTYHVYAKMHLANYNAQTFNIDPKMNTTPYTDHQNETVAYVGSFDVVNDWVNAPIITGSNLSKDDAKKLRPNEDFYCYIDYTSSDPQNLNITWYKNDEKVKADSPTYSYSSIIPGDSVKVVVADGNGSKSLLWEVGTDFITNPEVPIIKLSSDFIKLTQKSLEPGSAITGDVTVISLDTPQVTLYCRPIGSSKFSTYTMNASTKNQYQASFPSTIVDTPGIEFYIRAVNSTAPKQTKLYTIPVGSNETPSIEHDYKGLAYAQPGVDYEVIANAAIETGVVLYYALGNESFHHMVMENEPEFKRGYIPGEFIEQGKITYYYFEAYNTAGIQTRLPADPDYAFAINGRRLNEGIGEDGQAAEAVDPINLATGDQFYQNVLFQVPGRGLSAFFSIAYHSLNPENFPLPMGYGWTHNYNIRLFDEGQVIQIQWGDGHAAYYQRNADGTIVAVSPGNFDVLTQDAGTKVYSLTQPDQICYTFNADGFLTRISDRNGNAIRLDYTDYRLTQVTDSLDRVFTFEYDNDLRLTRVVYPEPELPELPELYVKFTYENGDLKSCRDLDGKVTIYDYNDDHRLLTITLPKGNKLLTNTFDNQGRIDTQSNGLGHTWEIQYDVPEIGKTTVKDPDEKYTVTKHDGFDRYVTFIDGDYEEASFLYNGQSQIQSITDKEKRTTTFDYTGPNLSSVVTPDNKENAIGYTAGNDPETIVFHKGAESEKSITMVYDGNGNLTDLTDFKDQSVGMTYNDFGQPKTITNQLDYVTTLSYENGYLSGMETHEKRTVSFKFNNLGRLESKTNGRGATTQYEYYSSGKLKTIKDAKDRVTEWVYDDNGNIKTVSYPGGAVWEYHFNDADRLEWISNPLKERVTYEYTDAGRLERIIYPSEFWIKYTYYDNGLVEKVENALGNSVSYEYTLNGDVTSKTDEKNRTWRYERDDKNRLKAVYAPDENAPTGERLISEYGYDDYDRVSSVKDGMGNEWKYTFDVNGNLKTVEDPDHNTVTYDYDNVDQLNTVVTNFNSEEQQILDLDYDGDGNLLTVKDGLDNTVSYHYDENGQMDTMTDKKGQLFTYNRDVLGRIDKEISPDGEQSFLFTPAGNIEHIDGPMGRTSMAYDVMDRLKSRTNVFGQTVSYDYNNKGTIKTLTYPGGKTVVMTYKMSGQLETVKDWNGKTTTYYYDSDQNLERIEYPNGVITTYRHDDSGRLTGLTHVYKQAHDIFGTRESLDMTYNPAGNIGTMDHQGGAPFTFMVDSASSANYDTLTCRVNGMDGATYGFDDNGNMTTETLPDSAVITYGYDAHNRLTQVVGAGKDSSYAYAAGLRVSGTVNGKTRRYVWDTKSGFGNVIVETDENNEPLYYYVYGLGLISRINASTGEYEYYHADHNGNVLALTNDTGTVTDRYGYEYFGSGIRHEGSSDNPYQFNGLNGVRLEGNGLLFMRARYYHMGLNRFLNPDPEIPNYYKTQTLNPYIYGLNNSLLFSDPDGHVPQLLVPIAAGAAIGAVGGGLVDLAWQAYETKGFKEGDYDWNRGKIFIVGGAITGGAAPVIVYVGSFVGASSASIAISGVVFDGLVGAGEEGVLAHSEGRSFSAADFTMSAFRNMILGEIFRRCGKLINNKMNSKWNDADWEVLEDNIPLRDLYGDKYFTTPSGVQKKVSGEYHNTVNVNPDSKTFGEVHGTLRIKPEYFDDMHFSND